MPSFTFKKLERITSLKEIDCLFERGRNSAAQAYPVRAVYQTLPAEQGEPAIKVLVSVAKKRLHHAVDRNRAKRQIREAYRLQHHQLCEQLNAKGLRMRVALIWLSDGPQPTASVFEAMAKILATIQQRLEAARK